MAEGQRSKRRHKDVEDLAGVHQQKFPVNQVFAQTMTTSRTTNPQHEREFAKTQPYKAQSLTVAQTTDTEVPFGGARPKHNTRSSAVNSEAYLANNNYGASTKSNTSPQVENSKPCIMRVHCEFKTHSISKTNGKTFNYECDIEMYMKWKFLQYVQLKNGHQIVTADGSWLCQNSTLVLQQQVTNMLHAEKMALSLIYEILKQNCSNICVQKLKRQQESSALDLIKQVDVYNEVVGDTLYIACPFVQIQVQCDLLKCETIVKEDFSQKFPQVTITMTKMSENAALCTLQGSAGNLDKGTSRIERLDKCMRKQHVQLNPEAARLFQKPVILDRVCRMDDFKSFRCALTVEDGHVYIFGFSETKVKELADLVPRLIVNWTWELSEQLNNQSESIVQLIIEQFGDCTVIDVKNDMRINVYGLNEDVEQVKTLVVEIKESRTPLERQQIHTKAENVPNNNIERFKIGEANMLFLEKSKCLEQLAEYYSCQISLNNADNVVEIRGVAEEVSRAKNDFDILLAKIKHRKIDVTDHTSQEYIKYSQFVCQVEAEHDVRIDAVNQTVYSNYSNLAIEKIQYDNGCILWSTNYSSSQRQLLVAQRGYKIYEGIQMMFIDHDQNSNTQTSRSDNTLTVQVPRWTDDVQNLSAELVARFFKRFEEISSRQIEKCVIYVQPVGGWEFNQFMRSIVEECARWLVNSANICPYHVSLVIDDVDDKIENKATVVDTFLLHYMTVDEISLVKVVEGTLDQTEADILVNTASPNLDLKRGRVSKSLLEAAGPQLQYECYNEYPDDIAFGAVAWTKGYKLKCRYVFHVTIPIFNATEPNHQDNYMNIRTTVVNCLSVASRYGHKTIAFPAIGTGQLGYPIEVVASEMFGSVQRFRQDNPNTSLQQVFFVIYHRDTEVLKLFREYESKFDRKQQPKEQHQMVLHITGIEDGVQKVKGIIKDRIREVSKPEGKITEFLDGVSKSVCTVLYEMFYTEIAGISKTLTSFKYDRAKHGIILKGRTTDVLTYLCMLRGYMDTIRKMRNCHIHAHNLKTTVVTEVLEEIKKTSCNGAFYYVYDKNEYVIELFAKDADVFDIVKSSIESKIQKLLHRADRSAGHTEQHLKNLPVEDHQDVNVNQQAVSRDIDIENAQSSTVSVKTLSVYCVEADKTTRRLNNDEITVNICYKAEANRLMCIITENQTCYMSVYGHDIFQVENVEALVCGEDKGGSGRGMIAKLLRHQGGNQYLESKAEKFTHPGELHVSDVVICSGGSSNFRKIMHVIMSRNSSRLYDVYRNVFEEIRRTEIQSVVLPLLGTGTGDISPIDSAEALWVEWVQHCEKYRDNLIPVQIHVVIREQDVLMEVQDLFRTYVENIEKRRENASLAESRKLSVAEKLEMSVKDKSKHPSKKSVVREDGAYMAETKAKTNAKPVEKDVKEAEQGDVVHVVEDRSSSTSKKKSVKKTEDNCVICMDKLDNPKTLKCGHKFCTDCIDGYFKVKQVCPTCGTVCGVITGDQPDGSLDMYKRRLRLAGYDKGTCIALTYTFPASVQGPKHPQPGKPYKSMRRTGYLPDTPEGHIVCAMMREAFRRRLTFTIGTSRTTGEQGVITWNDIHHKTDPKPNTQFGYPDPSYLDRVTDELAVKGVTPGDVDQDFLESLKDVNFKTSIKLDKL